MRKTRAWSSGSAAFIIATGHALIISPLTRAADAEVVHWGEAVDPVMPLDNVAELTNVISVAAGNWYSVALRADGSVLGFPYREWWTPAATLLTASNIVALEVGGTDLALRADGTVATLNDAVPTPPHLSNVVAIAKGSAHRLALRSDGAVMAWGDNSRGQLNVPPGLSNVMAIAAGWYHNLAVRPDGTVAAWGDNAYGQATVPPELSNVVAVAAGRAHSLALRVDGTVEAWGPDSHDLTEVPDGLSNVVALTAGQRHSMALRADGTLAVWGDELSGHRYIPPGTTNVLAIAGGEYHSLALLGGTADSAPPLFIGPSVLIGTADYPFHHRLAAKHGPRGFSADELPAGLTLNPDSGVITGVPKTAGQHRFTVKATNMAGEGRREYTFFVNRPFPAIRNRGLVQVPLGSDFIERVAMGTSARWFEATGLPPGLQIDATTGVISGAAQLEGVYPVSLVASNEYGYGYGNVTMRVSSVIAWGNNDGGPLDVPLGLEDVTALATGYSHTMALRANGSVIGWGRKWDPSQGFQAFPPPPASLTQAVAISAGYDHRLALRADGSVVRWGQLVSRPRGESNVVAIAAGNQATYVVRSDGSLGWSHPWPIPTGLSNLTAVSAGSGRAVALRADGTVLNLSDGSTFAPGLASIVAIAAGRSHVVALRGDGTVLTAGGWYDANLRQYFDFPPPPPDLRDVVAIAAGDSHALALRADGTLAAWGNNYSGQTDIPPGLRNVVAITAWGDHSLALVGYRADFAPPRFTTPPFLVATVDYPFQQHLRARGNPSAFSVDGLPGGLVFDATTSVIQGTPQTAGTYRVILTATNAIGAAQREVTLFVNEALPAILNQGPVPAWLGNPFTHPLRAEFAPTWFGAAGLPPGLSLDPSTGLISGVPTEEGRFVTALVARNRFGFGSGTLRIDVGVVARWDSGNLTILPGGLTNLVTLTAGGEDLGLSSDARVLTLNDTSLPSGLTDVVALAAGAVHSLALQADGTVRAWGRNDYGQTDVPMGLSNVVAISSGAFHGLALRADGTVVGWGLWGSVPAGLSNVVAVAAGRERDNLALLADGRVVLWDSSDLHSTGLSNIVAVAGGNAGQLALHADGTVFSVYPFHAQPTGLSNVVAMAAGYNDALALRADGKVVRLGPSLTDLPQEQEGLQNVIAIAVSDYHNLALVSHVPALFRDGQVKPGSNVRLVVPLMEGEPAFIQWQHNGEWLPGATNPILELSNIRAGQLGTYTALTRLPFATITHASITLDFLPGLHLITEPTVITRRLDREAELHLRVLNAGPGDATGVVLAGEVGPAFDMLDAAVSQGATQWAEGSFSAQLDGLAAGSEAEVRLVLRSIAVGDGAFRISVRSENVPGEEVAIGFAVFDALPELTAESSESGSVLTWPLAASGFELEETSSLSPPVRWQRSVAYPAVSGDRFRIQLPDGDGAVFYRLAR